MIRPVAGNENTANPKYAQNSSPTAPVNTIGSQAMRNRSCCIANPKPISNSPPTKLAVTAAIAHSSGAGALKIARCSTSAGCVTGN